MEFEKKTITAVYIGGDRCRSCLSGDLFAELWFRVRGRSYPVRLQFNGRGDVEQAGRFMEQNKPGARAALVRIGCGKYASYKLTGV